MDKENLKFCFFLHQIVAAVVQMEVLHTSFCLTAEMIGNNLDWFLDMFWLALHTLLSNFTVSQVLTHYILPLMRQP